MFGLCYKGWQQDNIYTPKRESITSENGPEKIPEPETKFYVYDLDTYRTNFRCGNTIFSIIRKLILI